ncbi:predicted protein [Naegleria gruberi]|uniref:Predicted protein n=1 Tax=Naegleria gruberi TaxID=5762 RepID=D2VZ95_NAEGR|nr:uncharacterized protein NAEGRDRAFT_53447 [Naegleria gruberi]EFC37805.1 predicted protein [Naegleria gruberi]|eukprot:XP_002670549.1 predicted protein [Naegleria gruberi strain NEG-M]
MMDHSNLPFNTTTNSNTTTTTTTNAKKKLADTFSSRTKLEFKSSSSEYNDVDQQEETSLNNESSSSTSNQQHSNPKWTSLLESRESSLADEEEEADTRPLYERLMENKLKKQQELEQVIGNQAPRSLDEDDILYLKEQEEKLKNERLEIINKEKEEIQKYLQESHIVIKDTSINSGIDSIDNIGVVSADELVEQTLEKEDLISQLEIVEVKKRKRKDENEKKKKKKNNTSSSNLLTASALNYDSS